MKDGFVKIALASPKLKVADCGFNADEIVKTMRRASADGTHLLLLPELSVTGYTCEDLFFQKTLIDGAEASLARLAAASAEVMPLVVAGAPVLYENKLYNCAVVLYHGEILGVVPKQNVPNYGEFYERRHFAEAPGENGTVTLAGFNVPFGMKLLFCCREMPEFRMAVEVCEDLWVPSSPSVGHALAGALIVGNLSASDETVSKADYRRTLVQGQSARLACAYAYADAGSEESSTDLVFSGHNLLAENGALIAESVPFGERYCAAVVDLQMLVHERARLTTYPDAASEGYQTVPFSMPVTATSLAAPYGRRVQRNPFIPEDQRRLAKCASLIMNIQAHGLCKRVEHTSAAKMVVGVSGGLDSCLALLVAVRAADLLKRSRKNIMAVTMPCFGTTSRTRGNAERLCEALGVSFSCVDITESVIVHFRALGQDLSSHDTTYENAQARERTQLLMDLANKENGLVIGTGDLSELALGWTTYSGDHMSMYGVNASVPKTLVRCLVRHEAERSADTALKQVLLDILDTPVSPELLPALDGEISQKTEDIVGPYELHDFFLYCVVRYGFAPVKVYRLAQVAFAGVYDDEVLLKWLRNFYRRFFAQQFKRSCLPDGPKVGSVSLSPRGDWRMPSDACAALWIKELDGLR